MKSSRLILSAACAVMLGVSLISCGGGGDSSDVEVATSVTPLRLIPGFTLNACIDEFTKTGYVTPQTLMAAGGNLRTSYEWRIDPPPPVGVNVATYTGVFSSVPPSTSSSLYTELKKILPGKLLTVSVSDGTSSGELTATGTVPFNISTLTSAPIDGVPGVGCPITVLQQLPYSSVILNNAYADKVYGATLYVAGGTPPYHWAEDTTYTERTGLATVGLFLDPMYGLVRGTLTSTASGKTVKFRVIVTDGAGDVAVYAPVYSINVQ